MQKIINKMLHDYSPVILVVGPPNSGKTMLSAIMAEILYPIFNKGKEWDYKEYTVFDMNTLSHRFLKMRKTPIVIAEAGYELAFDQWFDKTNKFFDRIVTTQRVMGNCYFLNIPVGKDLARRHRRKINYILKVRGHGRFVAKINRIKDDIMSGNEFRPFYLEEYFGVPLPKCHKALKKLDDANKNVIREQIISDYQKEQEAKREYVETREPVYSRITCIRCKHTWPPKTKHPIQCPRCGHRLRWGGEHKKEHWRNQKIPSGAGAIKPIKYDKNVEKTTGPLEELVM